MVAIGQCTCYGDYGDQQKRAVCLILLYSSQKQTTPVYRMLVAVSHEEHGDGQQADGEEAKERDAPVCPEVLHDWVRDDGEDAGDDRADAGVCGLRA